MPDRLLLSFTSTRMIPATYSGVNKKEEKIINRLSDLEAELKDFEKP